MEKDTPSTNPPVHQSRLLDVLEALEKQIMKQNSLKLALLRGVVYGLGTVIGATILVTLLGWIIKITIGDLSTFLLRLTNI